MAENEAQPAMGNDEDETRFNGRFSAFVKSFVGHFEEKLDHYCKVSEGKLSKISKRGNVLEYVVTTVFAGLGVLLNEAEIFTKAGQIGGRLLGKYFGMKHHQNRANKIHAAFIATETVKLRATLVETAADIFRSFEMQFMTIESKMPWHQVMQELAYEAVERIINYTYTTSSSGVNPDVLTTAFVLGKSKIEKTFDPLQHNIKFQGNACKITKFYDKACLCIPGNPKDKFYRCRKSNPKYGCRFIFKWEHKNIVANPEYENFEPESTLSYKYVLLSEDVMNKKMLQVLHSINDEDPKFKLDQLYQGFNNWMQIILNSLDTVLEKLTKSQDVVDSCDKKKGNMFNVQKPIQSFTGRDTFLKQEEGIHDALQKEKKVAIVGPGGIGKTELIRKFVENFVHEYDRNIVWINCSRKVNIIASFKKVAKEVNVSKVPDFMCEEGKLLGTPFFVLQVHSFFSDKKCLFVFDDVDKLNDIQEFLPAQTPDSGTNVFVLAISRQEIEQDWKTIALESFTQDEATKFLQDKLGTREFVQDDITKVVETVGHFPLALELVAACVEQNRKEDPVSEVVDSLKKRDECDSKGDTDKVFHGVVSLSMELIRQEDFGERTLERLRPLTFYFFENIPFKIVSILFNDDANSGTHDVFKELLRKYSFIVSPGKRHVFNLNKVVQESLRKSFSEEEEKKILSVALSSLRQSTSEEHVVAVWESATRHDDLVNKFKSETYGGEYNTILHLFAKNGHFHATTNLLKAFQDEESKKKFLNLLNKSSNTALHLAAKNGFIEIVKYLIEKENVDVNIRNKMERTPFEEAIVKGHLHVIQHFAQKLDSSARNEENLGLLCWAAAGGHLQVLEYFIKTKKLNFLQRGSAPCLPIHKACRSNKQDIVEYLLSWPGADVCACDQEGNTPLHISAQYGHMQLVKYLIEEKGARVSHKNRFGKTPAHCAVKSNNLDMVIYFWSKESRKEHMCASRKYSLWHEAAYNGKLKILKHFHNYCSTLLKKEKLPVNSVDSHGNTLLHEASAGGHLDVVKYLVETHNAKVNISNKYNQLPIHRAANCDRPHIVKYFLENCMVEVDVQVNCGGTPLHEAAYGGSLPVVKLLVDAGANIEECNNYNRTPLFGAIKNTSPHNKTHQHKHIHHEKTHDEGCKMHTKDCECRKSLIFGEKKPITHCKTQQRYTHLDIVKYLVQEKGCKIDIKDYKGRTPLQVAEEKNNVEAATYLKTKLVQTPVPH